MKYRAEIVLGGDEVNVKERTVNNFVSARQWLVTELGYEMNLVKILEMDSFVEYAVVEKATGIAAGSASINEVS